MTVVARVLASKKPILPPDMVKEGIVDDVNDGGDFVGAVCGALALPGVLFHLGDERCISRVLLELGLHSRPKATRFGLGI